MKFAVINAHQPNYVSLAMLTTWGNRTEYCKRHGYSLLVKVGDWTMPACHPVTWDRFKFMRTIVASKTYDWVYVCGTDSLHTNFKTTLESFIDPEFHVIISSEWCSPVQADSFLVRSSPEGVAWCDDILAQYDRLKNHAWVEQQAMIELLTKWRHLIKILPQRQLNSYDYALYRKIYPGESRVENGQDFFGNDGQWQIGDFLIHWPGLPLHQRLQLATHYSRFVIK